MGGESPGAFVSFLASLSPPSVPLCVFSFLPVSLCLSLLLFNSVATVQSSPNPSTDLFPLNRGFFPESTEVARASGAWEQERAKGCDREALPSGTRSRWAWGAWRSLGIEGGRWVCTRGLRMAEGLDGNDCCCLTVVFLLFWKLSETFPEGLHLLYFEQFLPERVPDEWIYPFVPCDSHLANAEAEW